MCEQTTKGQGLILAWLCFSSVLVYVLSKTSSAGPPVSDGFSYTTLKAHRHTNWTEGLCTPVIATRLTDYSGQAFANSVSV